MNVRAVVISCQHPPARPRLTVMWTSAFAFSWANYTDSSRRSDPDPLLRYFSRGTHVCRNLTMFLRYLVVHNLCDPALVDALPTIAHWKRASCPNYLTKEEGEKF